MLIMTHYEGNVMKQMKLVEIFCLNNRFDLQYGTDYEEHFFR